MIFPSSLRHRRRALHLALRLNLAALPTPTTGRFYIAPSNTTPRRFLRCATEAITTVDVQRVLSATLGLNNVELCNGSAGIHGAAVVVIASPKGPGAVLSLVSNLLERQKIPVTPVINIASHDRGKVQPQVAVKDGCQSATVECEARLDFDSFRNR